MQVMSMMVPLGSRQTVSQGQGNSNNKAQGVTAGRKGKPATTQTRDSKKGRGGSGGGKGPDGRPDRVSRRGTYLEPPGHPPKPCLAGTKQSILVDMLSRPGGATMEELIEALSGGRKAWRESTVRSGFSWDMKLKGYGVRSEFDVTGEERFHIMMPKGFRKIPKHLTQKEWLRRIRKEREERGGEITH